ncbi:MAG: hypothetical protein Q9227_008789 [Pyrenula ochraceoflavens]
MDDRPTKKRRFFADVDDALEASANLQRASSDASVNTSPSDSASTHGFGHSSVTDCVDVEEEKEEKAVEAVENGFDRETFTAFVGEDVPSDVLLKLREAADGDMERAINMYLDGSWKNSYQSLNTAQNHDLQQRDSSSMRSPAPHVPLRPQRSESQQIDTEARPDNVQLLRKMAQSRYVGAFGVGGWATRSGNRLLQHGERVKIERTRMQPKQKVGRGGRLVNTTARFQKGDVITRFTNEKGEEIGRFPRETADWVSTLLDQKVIRLEGSCVYAPDSIRVNDTIYLQLRCFLLKSAFEVGAFLKSKDDNRATGIFEEKESAEEKDLRLRQVSLVRLFDEINLHPTSTNDMTARHKRDGLLRAAEISEQFETEKGPAKGEQSQNGTSTPPSEEEDGKELEEDQLDTLYKKAQSFDFNSPEREPAASFAMDLRRYQKQALHWMVQKETQQATNRAESMHPLWEEYTWPAKDVDDNPLPVIEQLENFYINPYSGEISLEFPVQEQNCLGGILADEMGLGKTIEMVKHLNLCCTCVAFS